MSFIHEIYRGDIPNFTEVQFSSDPRTTVLAECEGEIHNSQEIRDKLKKSAPGADENNNKLVADAYREWGEECFRGFNGAFAFHIFDKTKRKLILVRDQIGRMPLYYSDLSNRFIFSSDLSEIVKSKGFPREIDLGALNFYLAFRYIPEDKTIFRNVRRVLPGCCVSYDIDSGSLRETKYWEPPLEEAGAGDEEELLLELDMLFEEAVRMRLAGKADPGAFLSGGLDSSLIVAFMSRLSSKPVKTFIVGYSDKHYDETRYSQIVSDYFGTDHHELLVKPDRDHFLDCVSKFHEPLADPSIIPTSHALELAGANINYVLSGDGADGLFLGFRTHQFSLKHLAVTTASPKVLKYLKGKIAGVFPEEHRFKIFLEDLTSKQFFIRRNTVFNNVVRRRLFKPWVTEELRETIDQPEEYAASVFESYRGTFGGKMGFFTYKSDPDDILYKIFNLSRHLDLKVRTPFLDTSVIEFALGKVPANLKLKGNTTKYILKRLGKKYLPPELPLERKRGFNPPLSGWLRNEWSGFATEILLDGDDEFFDRRYIERLLELNKSSRSDQTRKLFTLMVFKIWKMKYV